MKDNNNFFMKVAIILAQESKCVSKKVGAIITKDGRIISSGYNGTPAGHINCKDHFKNGYERESHHEWSNANEIHAEMNAILFASKVGLSLNGCEMYTLVSPCIQCAKVIVGAGISKVYFRERYDRETDGLIFLENNGVFVLGSYLNKSNKEVWICLNDT